MRNPGCPAWVTGVVAVIIAGSLHGEGLSSTYAAAAWQDSLDQQYAAAIAAGARPDVAKAGRLDSSNYRGTFRLRFGAAQYLSRSGVSIRLTDPGSVDQPAPSVWTAEPGSPGRFSWVLVPDSDVYWSIRPGSDPHTDRLFLFRVEGRASRQAEEQFFFMRVVRDKAFVKIKAPLVGSEGYFQAVNGEVRANGSAKTASLFIVE